MVKHTNSMLSKIRKLLKDCEKDKKILKQSVVEAINHLIDEEERNNGFVDMQTLKANIGFNSISSFTRRTLYNRVRDTDYKVPKAYLKGVEIRSVDYKELISQYGYDDNIVYIADPPYFSTNCDTYTQDWNLQQHLDFIMEIPKMQNLAFFIGLRTGFLELIKFIEKLSDIRFDFRTLANSNEVFYIKNEIRGNCKIHSNKR